jgi:hypothetical protein
MTTYSQSLRPQRLSTHDNGKTVTMTSTVTVHPFKDERFSEGIIDQSFSFSPALRSGNSQNKDYGETRVRRHGRNRL